MIKNIIIIKGLKCLKYPKEKQIILNIACVWNPFQYDLFQ